MCPQSSVCPQSSPSVYWEAVWCRDVPGWLSAFACECVPSLLCVPSLHRLCTGRLSGVGDVPGWQSAFACECVPSLLCVPSPHRPCTGRLSGVGDVPGWQSAFACECVPSLLCVPSLHHPCTGRLSGVGMSPVGSQRLRVNVSPVFCVSPVLTGRVLGGCLVSGMYSVHNVTKLF